MHAAKKVVGSGKKAAAEVMKRGEEKPANPMAQKYTGLQQIYLNACQRTRGVVQDTGVLMALRERKLSIDFDHYHDKELDAISVVLNARALHKSIAHIDLALGAGDDQGASKDHILRPGAKQLLTLTRCLGLCISNARSLVTIDVFGIPLGSGEVDLLASGLEKNTTIKKFLLRRTHIGDRNMPRLSKALSESQVTVLSLIECSLTDECAHEVIHVLKSHAARRNELLWSESLRYPADVKIDNENTRVGIPLTGLLVLDLSKNKFTDTTMTALCHYLKFDEWLLSLNFRGNEVGLDGMRALMRTLKDHPASPLLVANIDTTDVARGHIGRQMLIELDDILGVEKRPDPEVIASDILKGHVKRRLYAPSVRALEQFERSVGSPSGGAVNGAASSGEQPPQHKSVAMMVEDLVRYMDELASGTGEITRSEFSRAFRSVRRQVSTSKDKLEGAQLTKKLYEVLLQDEALQGDVSKWIATVVRPIRGVVQNKMKKFELFKAMEKLSETHPSMAINKTQVVQMMRFIDVNGNDELDQNEIEMAFTRVTMDTTFDSLENHERVLFVIDSAMKARNVSANEVFTALDTENNGSLTVEELCTGITTWAGISEASILQAKREIKRMQIEQRKARQAILRSRGSGSSAAARPEQSTQRAEGSLAAWKMATPVVSRRNGSTFPEEAEEDRDERLATERADAQPSASPGERAVHLTVSALLERVDANGVMACMRRHCLNEFELQYTYRALCREVKEFREREDAVEGVLRMNDAILQHVDTTLGRLSGRDHGDPMNTSSASNRAAKGGADGGSARDWEGQVMAVAPFFDEFGRPRRGDEEDIVHVLGDLADKGALAVYDAKVMGREELGASAQAMSLIHPEYGLTDRRVECLVKQVVGSNSDTLCASQWVQLVGHCQGLREGQSDADAELEAIGRVLDLVEALMADRHWRISDMYRHLDAGGKGYVSGTNLNASLLKWLDVDLGVGNSWSDASNNMGNGGAAQDSSGGGAHRPASTRRSKNGSVRGRSSSRTQGMSAKAMKQLHARSKRLAGNGAKAGRTGVGGSGAGGSGKQAYPSSPRGLLHLMVPRRQSTVTYDSLDAALRHLGKVLKDQRTRRSFHGYSILTYLHHVVATYMRETKGIDDAGLAVDMWFKALSTWGSDHPRQDIAVADLFQSFAAIEDELLLNDLLPLEGLEFPISRMYMDDLVDMLLYVGMDVEETAEPRPSTPRARGGSVKGRKTSAKGRKAKKGSGSGRRAKSEPAEVVGGQLIPLDDLAVAFASSLEDNGHIQGLLSCQAAFTRIEEMLRERMWRVRDLYNDICKFALRMREPGTHDGDTSVAETSGGARNVHSVLSVSRNEFRAYLRVHGIIPEAFDDSMVSLPPAARTEAAMEDGSSNPAVAASFTRGVSGTTELSEELGRPGNDFSFKAPQSNTASMMHGEAPRPQPQPQSYAMLNSLDTTALDQVEDMVTQLWDKLERIETEHQKVATDRKTPQQSRQPRSPVQRAIPSPRRPQSPHPDQILGAGRDEGFAATHSPRPAVLSPAGELLMDQISQKMGERLKVLYDLDE